MDPIHWQLLSISDGHRSPYVYLFPRRGAVGGAHTPEPWTGEESSTSHTLSRRDWPDVGTTWEQTRRYSALSNTRYQAAKSPTPGARPGDATLALQTLQQRSAERKQTAGSRTALRSRANRGQRKTGSEGQHDHYPMDPRLARCGGRRDGRLVRQRSGRERIRQGGQRLATGDQPHSHDESDHRTKGPRRCKADPGARQAKPVIQTAQGRRPVTGSQVLPAPFGARRNRSCSGRPSAQDPIGRLLVVYGWREPVPVSPCRQVWGLEPADQEIPEIRGEGPRPPRSGRSPRRRTQHWRCSHSCGRPRWEAIAALGGGKRSRVPSGKGGRGGRSGPFKNVSPLPFLRLPPVSLFPPPSSL